MRRRIGEMWIALGILHFPIIVALGWSTIGDIVGDGYVNAINDNERAAVFWLFYLGAPFLIIGVLARWAQKRVGTLPESMGWVALVAFGVGVLAVPTSGFWLGLVLAGYSIAVSRRDARDSVAVGETVNARTP